MSTTHMALSSTRVMGTGMSCGQAVGTAVGLMLAEGLDGPAEVVDHIAALQQRLLRDDCYLPRVPLDIPELTRAAALTASAGDAEPVRDGWSRQIGDDSHAWLAAPGGWLCYTFDASRPIAEVAVALDTQMHMDVQFSWSMHCVGRYRTTLPDTLPQRFTIEVCTDGQWSPVVVETANIHRHIRRRIDRTATAIRLRLDRLHGTADQTRVYSFIVW